MNTHICTYALVLFLNKYDLFKKKVKKVDLGDYFPDYNGTYMLCFCVCMRMHKYKYMYKHGIRKLC